MTTTFKPEFDPTRRRWQVKGPADQVRVGLEMQLPGGATVTVERVSRTFEFAGVPCRFGYLGDPAFVATKITVIPPVPAPPPKGVHRKRAKWGPKKSTRR